VTVKRSRDDRVMVADRLGRHSGILHDAVRVVEVLGGQAGESHLSQIGMVLPLDLGTVGAQRRG
jgi:hypothetical protein